MKDALFTQTSGIILSAGNSARMRTHKALLKFDSEKTFLQKITETYLLSGIEQLIVVVNFELFELIRQKNYTLPEKVKLVINEKPELGRFFSLQTGLKHVTAGNSCFFQNIDNPFTSAKLLGDLIIHKNEADVIIPAFHDKTGHPVLINHRVVKQICSTLDFGVRIDQFLKQFSEKRLQVKAKNILANINTKEEYLDSGFKL